MTITSPSRAMVGSIRSILEQARVERQREQVLEAVMAFDLGKVREHDFEVAAELPQNLTARATGRRGVGGISDNRDSRERSMALGQRLEHGHTLGAHRQTVGRVL